MLKAAAGQMLCLVAAGFAFAITCVCALFARIAASQKSAIGCFVLAGVLCCLLATLLLSIGLM